jgi:coenzyme F420-reducing hydrogenase beta subunit
VNLTIRGENDSVKISNYQDLYTIAFFKNLIFRESCYNCDYAQELRIGDLTLGDFWGLGKETPFCGDVKDGVSLVLINTEKGKKLFHYLFAEKELFAEKRSMQEAKKGNPNLEKATVKNQYYEKFYKLYKNYGLKRSMQKLFWLDLIKYRAFEIVMKIIKK